MYRVVTKSMMIVGRQRRRCIQKGPWQPVEDWAHQWAEFLRSTGLYDAVVVESNGSGGSQTQRL